MSVLGDPTPCPQPRHGILKNSRLSLVAGIEPSVTLPEAPKLPGLRDAKPHRPKKRQSVGWDPTVDIYNDTFELRQSASTQPQSAVPSTESVDTRGPLVKDHARRTSTLFAQPAQRAALAAPREIGSSCSPRKRRLSSMVEQSLQSDISLNHNKQAPLSSLQKEARRRTIYIPNDTTVITIHPGAPLQNPSSKIAKPQKSDVFLDFATLTEDEICEDKEQIQPRVSEPKKLLSRPSLAGAPRRVPLQSSVRHFQPSAAHVDVPGNGQGKENLPPGGAVPKRLGKRASLLLSEKYEQKPSMGLAIVSEDSELKVTSEPSAKSNCGSSQHQPYEGDSSNKQLGTRRSMSSFQASRRISCLNAAPSAKSHSRSCSSTYAVSHRDPVQVRERVPTSLSVPNIEGSNSINVRRYSVLPEDIAHPEMYEENWLSYQEQSITQLANSLLDKANGQNVFPQEHGKRQELLNLYHSSDNALLHKRLQASLRFGALNIPPETLTQVARFKDDFGQRQRFLDLWTKTYDPESLQLAAEVVVGRKRVSTPRNSGNGSGSESSPSAHRTKTTAKFLNTFLVQNQDLATRQSISIAGPPSPGNLEAGKSALPSTAQCWRRTALRSLMIILLLDQAQAQAFFKGRNLFQATSPYKSSLAVLHGLCRLLIPSVGDVSRVVGHLGYHVQHIQYPLEEFEYSITNLATDLRDGVRLTRLVECLLYPPGSLDFQQEGLTVTIASGDVLTSRNSYNGNQGALWPLSQHLKFPCTSRPQRIYNVEIALAALKPVKNADDGLLKDLNAADIVDGHREKTVRLLWGLVSRWGLHALVDFGLIDHEVARLELLHRRRIGSQKMRIDDDNDDNAELPYLPADERQARQLLAWARKICRLHGVTITNLTTSFASGAAYSPFATEYYSTLPSSAPQRGAQSLKAMLSSLGCSRSFVNLFMQPSTCPSKTTTTSLLAFLASRILPIMVPQQAARTIQRAYRGLRARREIRKKIVLRCLAEECAEVVQAQRRLVKAAVKLQKWWRGLIHERRMGRRRWV